MKSSPCLSVFFAAVLLTWSGPACAQGMIAGHSNTSACPRNAPCTSMPYNSMPSGVHDGNARIIGRAPPDQVLRINIGLRPPHMQEEEQFLASPHPPMSPQEWNARFAPSPQDEQAVVDWLQSIGLHVVQRFPNRLLVDAMGTVADVEKAFNVTMNIYSLPNVAPFYCNDRDPAIPASLQNIVQSVTGLNGMRLQASQSWQ